jgi:hypothetical protein
MLYLLQRHALPIKAHLRASLVLAYAVPATVLRPLLPPGLILDTYRNFGSWRLLWSRRAIFDRPSFRSDWG